MTSSYAEMSSSETLKTLQAIDSQKSDFDLDHDKTKILKQALPFTTEWSRIVCEDYSSTPFKKFHFLMRDNVICPLSYSPDPYHNNNLDQIDIHLNESNVTDYLEFYLDYFLSGQDRLRMVNHVDTIEWQDDLPPLTRKSLEKDLQQYPKIEKNDDSFFITAACLFRLSIMAVSFLIRPDGRLEIKDNQLMVDDLPVKSFP